MKQWMMAMAGVAALGACVQTVTSERIVPTPAEQACMVAVAREAGTTDVVVLSTAATQTGVQVVVGAGPERTRWVCTARPDASADGVMAMASRSAP